MSLLLLFAGASPTAAPPTLPQQIGAKAGLEVFAHEDQIHHLAALEDDDDVALALILTL